MIRELSRWCWDGASGTAPTLPHDVLPLCCGADGTPNALRRCSLQVVMLVVNTEPRLNSPNAVAHCGALEK